MYNVFQHLGANNHGHDYVVGDIHGCFTLLERKLQQVNFNIAKDRLICVGDLCDRGPESTRVIEFIDQPWFYSVCGNHDTFIMEAMENIRPLDRHTFERFWSQVGGNWWWRLEYCQKETIYNFVKLLPYMIQVETQSGEQVGIIHAEIPFGFNWDDCVECLLNDDRTCDSIIESLIWGRDRIVSGIEETISGVDTIYSGHTVIQHLSKYSSTSQPKQPPVPYQLGNVNFIDTGAYMCADNGVDPVQKEYVSPPHDLTIIQIQ